VIEVPLLRDPNGSRLQFWWSSIRDSFESTLLYDETYSLLATVALTDDSSELEKRWVAAEERHIQGFAHFYNRMKKLFEKHHGRLEALNTDQERMAWVETVIAHGKMGYSVMAPRILETGDSKLTAEEILTIAEEDYYPFLLAPTSFQEGFSDLLDLYLRDAVYPRNFFDSTETAFACDIVATSSPSDYFSRCLAIVLVVIMGIITNGAVMVLGLALW
jgi:hypothetical protein